MQVIYFDVPGCEQILHIETKLKPTEILTDLVLKQMFVKK